MPPSPLPFVLALTLFITPPAPAEPGPPPRAVRTDPAGDPLPPGAIARLGTVRFRTHGWGQQVFFSPDGTTLTAMGEPGLVRFWDVATGRAVREIKTSDLLFNSSADQSADGKTLAVFGLVQGAPRQPVPTLRLYDLASGKAIWTVRPADLGYSPIPKVRFTPDGRRLLTVAGADLRVWDARTGDELFRQKAREQPHCFDLSPDGRTAAVAGHALYLWDWESGAEPRKVDIGARAYCDLLVFAPDGKTVYVGDIGRPPRGYDVATGALSGRLEVGPSGRWVSFGRDGRLYAASGYNTLTTRQGTVAIRETASGKEVARLWAGPDNPAVSAWSRDGSRLAAITADRLWVWDVKTTRLLGPDAPGHDAAIGAVAFAPDGRVFTAGDDHTLRAWDPATGRQLLKLSMDGWVRGMALSPDGALLAGSALREDLRVWDARTGKEVFKLAGHGPQGGRRQVRFSADGRTLLSYGDDFYLRAWDVRTGKLRAEHRLRPPSPFAKGGEDEDDVRFEMVPLGPTDLGPDGKTFVIGTGKEVTAYDTGTGKERLKFEADPQWVHGLVVSADGRRLATTGTGSAPAPAKPGILLEQPKDYQVTVWDLAGARPVARFRVPGSAFNGVLAFTPDGGKVVTASHDSPLQFWDARTGAALGTADLPQSPGQVAFDADGKRMVVTFRDTTAVVYDLAAVLRPAPAEGRKSP